MESITVYILIVTYNAENWLDTCCYRQDALPHGWKIVVVDNGSSDNTCTRLEREFPHIHLIRNERNLGFGQANNVGLSKALADGADYALLLNQDASISIEGIQTLIKMQGKHPECLITSPLQLNGQGTELDFSFVRVCVPSSCPGLILDGARNNLRDMYYAKSGIAAVWLLSRKALQIIGGFSPLFFHYGEDDDYVNRVLFHGYKVGIVPAVSACHHRKQEEKKRPLGEGTTRKLVRLANPNCKDPSWGKVLASVFLPFLRHAVCANFSQAAFLLHASKDLLSAPSASSSKEIARRQGVSFL